MYSYNNTHEWWGVRWFLELSEPCEPDWCAPSGTRRSKPCLDKTAQMRKRVSAFTYSYFVFTITAQSSCQTTKYRVSKVTFTSCFTSIPCTCWHILVACTEWMLNRIYLKYSNFLTSNPFRTIPVSILYKSIVGRYRPVRVADGPITARCRFIKNASRAVSP